MPLGHISFNNTAEPKYDMLVSNMTCITHNSLVFYSCIKHLRINLARVPLLGNIVISKKFLHTRKIMVMHSNERGECCPRTLIDCKRKRYENVVDVVVRLHNPIDPSTKRMAPLRSAHVHLDDVPRTPIQQSFAGEFRQHDGMMTVLMMLLTQGFA